MSGEIETGASTPTYSTFITAVAFFYGLARELCLDWRDWRDVREMLLFRDEVTAARFTESVTCFEDSGLCDGVLPDLPSKRSSSSF